MASAPSTARTIVPQLMDRVKQLTPAQLRDFQRQFAAWQQKAGDQVDEEAALIGVCRARLSAADGKRLKTLVAKSERGTLQPTELKEYRRLAARAEQLDAVRLSALAQLVGRWRKPVREIMEIVGWEDGDDEATRHPAHAAKARSRSGR